MDAWPFLVARGRRRGHTVLLAPAALTTPGVIEDVVGPVPEGRGHHQADAPGGLHLVWTEHRVTDTELGGDATDEHGRPLRLFAGWVCVGARTVAVDQADLAHVLSAGLATYRRFLADEDRFTTEPSGAFTARSRIVPVSRPASARRASRTWGLAGLGVLVVAVVTAILLLTTGGEEPDPACPPPPRPGGPPPVSASERAATAAPCEPDPRP